MDARARGSWRAADMTDTNDIPSDELSEAEQALVAAVLAGSEADVRRRHVRAHVLRDLLLEARPGWRLPPTGLRLYRAVVEGTLDLEGVTLGRPIVVRHCRFEGRDGIALNLRDARLRRLGLHSCTVEGNIGADRLEVESGLYIGGGMLKGTFKIRGAGINGAFSIEDNEIGDGSAALIAAGMRVSGPLILRKSRFAGGIIAPRATIGAGVYAEGATIVVASGATTGAALDLSSASIGGDILLDGASLTGVLRLDAARLGGRLSAAALTVAASPTALSASGIGIGRGLSLQGAKFTGTVELPGADIGKALDAEGLEIDGGSAAFVADVIRIGGNCDFARARFVGEVSVPGAEIAGQLRMTEAKLYGAEVALRADGARVRGGAFLSRTLVFGTLRFPAAEIGNQFRMRGANVKVDNGAALLASGTRFNRDVELGDGFDATGAVVLDQVDVRGSLDLRGSRLSSNAVARAGAIRAQGVGPFETRALSLVDSRVGRLQMPVGESERPRGILDFSRLSVGSYEDHASSWPPPPAKRARDPQGRDLEHMILDGFVCEHLADPLGGSGGVHGVGVARRRIAWLDGQASSAGNQVFKPQAWVALEQRLEAQGHHDDARALAIERRRRERRGHGVGLGERWQGRLLDWFALYGHNPWRTIAWMALFVLMYAGIWSFAAANCKVSDCQDETVFTITNRDAYTPERFASVYPGFNALAYSFDLFVPFFSFGYGDHWRPNVNWQPIAELPLPDVGPWRARVVEPGGSAKSATLTLTLGGVLYVLSVVEQLLGLVLASLAVTGFTGLLQRGD